MGWTFYDRSLGLFDPVGDFLIFVGLLFSWWLFQILWHFLRSWFFWGLFKIVRHFWLSRLVVLFEDHNHIFYFSPSSFLSFSRALLWSRSFFEDHGALFNIPIAFFKAYDFLISPHFLIISTQLSLEWLLKFF